MTQVESQTFDEQIADLDRRAKKLRQPIADLERIDAEREMLLEQKARAEAEADEARREAEARENERLQLAATHARLADAQQCLAMRVSDWLSAAARTVGRAHDLGLELEPLAIRSIDFRPPAQIAYLTRPGERRATEAEIAESAARTARIRELMDELVASGHPRTYAEAIAIVDGTTEEEGIE